MFDNKKLMIFVAFLLVMAFSAMAVNANQLFFAHQIDTSKYPEIVAKVNGDEISGQNLATATAIEKSKWDKIGNPQSDTVCESLALRQLIINKMIESEAKQNNISISSQEAYEKLKNVVNEIMSLSDNPGKEQFLSEIKTCGYNSVEEYLEDAKVTEAYKKLLVRTKVRNQFYKSVPEPTENDINAYIQDKQINDVDDESKKLIKNALYQAKKSKAWKDHVDLLINSGDYEILAPIDIGNVNTPKLDLKSLENNDIMVHPGIVDEKEQGK